MKILVVGAGGREHAIIKKLKENPEVTEIFACPGNGGIAKDAECVNISATDLDGITDFAVKMNIDFCVVAPDDPLVLGLVDILESKGIPCFGPSKKAAIIEGSKVFSKNLMKKYGIPTAGYEVFSDPEEALSYIKEKNEYPTVIKADGLALGKGVIIAESEEQAEDAVKTIMEDKKFGDSGNNVVIEEFLTGPEVSVLSFTDGKTVVPMVSSMDHKRALDGDKGLNTGGMGTVAPNPYYTAEIAKECAEKIFLPTVKAMNNENRTFKGCLYFGLMLTPKGPKVIEYNCRFGDPETQAVLPLLDGDLAQIMYACAKGTLTADMVHWKDAASCCVIMASAGYPASSHKGDVISGLDAVDKEDVMVFHSGTAKKDGQYVTNGGRVLGVTAVAGDLKSAIEKAYANVKRIHFDGQQVRSDIGAKGLKHLK